MLKSAAEELQDFVYIAELMAEQLLFPVSQQDGI